MMPRLRVLAGPSPSAVVPITAYVNTSTPYTISSHLFEGQIVVNVKGFTDPEGRILDSVYFSRDDRKGITWSIQVQGRFLQPHSANDILFGNTFDRPLKLPWGTGAALTFAKLIDPTLEHDLTSTTKPWALAPLIATMPHFIHERMATAASLPSYDSLIDLDAHATPTTATFSNVKPRSSRTPFPPKDSIVDDTSQLHLSLVDKIYLSDTSSSSSSSLSSVSSFQSTSSNVSRKLKGEKKGNVRRDQLLHLQTASDRRSYFSISKHRKEIVFGPEDIITTDFCYGFFEFSPTLMLRLPGGLSFDLMKYWDGQPVRFMCCERKGNGILGDESDTSSESLEEQDPWGKVFWCVVVELVEDECGGLS